KKNLIEFLEFCLTKAPHVVYVPGNHEYYRSAINRADDKIGAILPKGVNYLNCDTYQFSHSGTDYVVHGCTLWSDIKNPEIAKYEMNDYNKIKVASIKYSPDGNVISHGGYTRMEPKTIQALHKTHRDW